MFAAVMTVLARVCHVSGEVACAVLFLVYRETGWLTPTRICTLNLNRRSSVRSWEFDGSALVMHTSLKLALLLVSLVPVPRFYTSTTSTGTSAGMSRRLGYAGSPSTSVSFGFTGTIR